MGEGLKNRAPWLGNRGWRGRVFKTYLRHSVVSWKKALYGTFPCLAAWQAVLNFSHSSIKRLLNFLTLFT